MTELGHAGETTLAMVIGDEDIAGSGSSPLAVLDPSTGEQIAELPCATADEVDRAVTSALDGARQMAASTPAQRVEWLHRLAAQLGEHAASLTELEVRDVGKVKSEAAAEVQSAASFLNGFAELCRDFPWQQASPDGRTTMTWDPVGVVASILPWNAPVAAVARRIGITIASGNATVIKPSELAPLAATAITRIARSAGLPTGAVNAVTGGPEVGRLVVNHSGIAKVAFTGGPVAGAEILKMSAETMRPVAVELGGKSPHVVLDGADLDVCVEGLVRGLTRNAGQVCTTGSRLLVHSSVKSDLMARLEAALGKLHVGSAHDDQTDMGPVISSAHRDRVVGFIERARTAGHPVTATSAVPDGPGFYVSPSIVADAKPGDEIFDDEVFGPVLAVTEFTDDAQAVELANATRFGLVAAIWTSDAERGENLAGRINAGLCWINGYWASPLTTSRHPRGQSGTGWMDFGSAGIREYLLPKAITKVG